jgi:HEAT repeat protein
MNSVVTALRAHLVTITVWVVILLVATGLILNGRAQQAHQIAALSSPDPRTRDAMVQTLVQGGRLADVLTDTEDPNSDATSPQNVRSAQIRENAAASVDRLLAAGRVSSGQAMDALFLLCKDSDTTVQTTAEAGLQALGQKSGAGLDDIVARLKDGDPDIRGAAAVVLGLIGGVKTADKVDAVIANPTSQDAAESALQKIGAPAVADLSRHLTDPAATVDFRQQIIDVLGAIGTPNTLAPLTAQAHADQPSLRREALVSLANIVVADGTALQKARAAKPLSLPAVRTAQDTFAQAARVEPILVAALRDTDADSQVRSEAALALGDTAGPDAVGALVGVLNDYDTQVRQAAVAGLQSAGPGAVVPLTAALAHGDEQARAGAAEALGGVGDPQALAALNAAFAAPGTPASVRRGAALGLGRSGSLAAIPTLVRALGDPDGDVQSAASDALLSPSLSSAAVMPLIAAFTQPTPVPFNAAQTLARMGNQAVPALEAASRSADPRSQTWAAVTLGETDSKVPGILTSLKPLTAGPDPEVRFAATQAISRLSGS